jgi:metal-responsive CopG/Arc/MetJ family transcriptional regulator
MVVKVRLDSELEALLNTLSKQLHKKRSDIIREAISFYAKTLEDTKKSRLHRAIDKSITKDYDEYKTMEATLDDSITFR